MTRMVNNNFQLKIQRSGVGPVSVNLAIVDVDLNHIVFKFSFLYCVLFQFNYIEY